MALVSKAFGDIITFTRASTATYFDSAGTLQSAAIDAPRLDYNPSTLAAQGLLIEESRTNNIRNNTMVGAVAGTPGTLPTNWVQVLPAGGTFTRNIVGIGTENGITYIEIQYTGTPAASNNYQIYSEGFTTVAASSGQTWTGTLYAKLVGGSFAGISSLGLTVYERNSVGGFVAGTQNNFTPTSSALNTQRYTTTRTLTDATTAAVQSGLIFAFTGAAIDITLRIGLPQLELGAFATSVIPTTTTALTRAADVASVNTLSPWYNATEGTLFAEVVSTGYVLNTSFPIAASIDDGSNNNRITAYQGGSAVSASVNVRSSSISATIGDSGVDFSASVVKLAGAFSGTSVSVTVNGGSVVAGTTNGMPSGLTTMRLGGTNSLYLSALNGYLRRITYYPRAFPPAQLQALTA